MSLHAELIAEMQQFCATRPKQSLLRQMIERWIRALEGDTEQRAAFEAGILRGLLPRER